MNPRIFSLLPSNHFNRKPIIFLALLRRCPYNIGTKKSNIIQGWPIRFFCKTYFSHFTIIDFGKPVIGKVSTNYSVTCGDPITPQVLGYPSVSDTLDPNPSISYVDSDIPTGCTTLRLWTATDHAGNQATLEQSIQSTSLLPIKVRLMPFAFLSVLIISMSFI